MAEQTIDYYDPATDTVGEWTFTSDQALILDAWRERVASVLGTDMPAVVNTMVRAGVPRRAAENIVWDEVDGYLNDKVPAAGGEE